MMHAVQIGFCCCREQFRLCMLLQYMAVYQLLMSVAVNVLFNFDQSQFSIVQVSPIIAATVTHLPAFVHMYFRSLNQGLFLDTSVQSC